jgi:hypothetical protein
LDIEFLARKLKPLMPKQVEDWLRMRDLGDPSMQDVIDKAIVGTSQKLLGDYRNKVFLSLPPEGYLRGVFNIGNVLYEKEKWPVAIQSGELLQNLFICGRSGAGKTSAVFHLLRQFTARGVPFLFLDWKRTARHLIPSLKAKVNVFTPGREISQMIFNPLIVPPNLEHNVYINHVIDAMADAYTLGDGSRSILQKAISACYRQGNLSPTISEILEIVNSMPAQRRQQDWKISVVRALESLEFSGITPRDKTTQEELVRTLLRENTIIELDGLSQNTRRFLIPIICLWIYYVQLGTRHREKLQSVVIVEEAHNVFYGSETHSKESTMAMLLRQCREIGMCMIIVDQHPYLISSAVLGNCYTSICLNLKNPKDINQASGLSLVEGYDRRIFSLLDAGQAVVKMQDRWKLPFLVKFPYVPIDKGMVTDDVLQQYLLNKRLFLGDSVISHSDGNLHYLPNVDFQFHHSALLYDAIAFPDVGVNEHYKNIGVGVKKGNNLKNDLLREGLLKETVVKHRQTYRNILRVTDDAREYLGIPDTPEGTPQGSLEHEFWKHYYARELAKQGYEVEVETSRRIGNSDIKAEIAGDSVVFEIETGKSNVVHNVKQNLLCNYKKIIVVCTSEDALQKVERQLAKANLIIPGRIEIVLRDAWLMAQPKNN